MGGLDVGLERSGMLCSDDGLEGSESDEDYKAIEQTKSHVHFFGALFGSDLS